MQSPFSTSPSTQQQQQPQQQPQPQSPRIPSSQPHFMPTPTEVPWNLNEMPWTVASHNSLPGDGVMKFCANPALDAIQRRALLHKKRKINFPATPVYTSPPKQFITEEKIAAHLNGLHISSDYTQHSGELTSTYDVGNAEPMGVVRCGASHNNIDFQITARELVEKLKNARGITFCEQIRKLQEQNRHHMLPDSFFGRVERPCTALVPWKPPPVADLLQMKRTDKNKCHNTSETNSIEIDIADNAEIEDDEFAESVADEIDDYVDNNNTYPVDLNMLKVDDMDEDL